jgi:hypothetical protein
MITINQEPCKLTDLSTNKTYDVYWLNFPPFNSNGRFIDMNMYWPEFLIKEECIPGKIWYHKDKLWEDKVFQLVCIEDVTRCVHREYVRIQLYWTDKYTGYLVFRPYTIENNLEIIKRIGDNNNGTK